MKRIFPLLGLFLLSCSGAGCAGHYWECKAGKAGVFNQPVPYQQATGPVSIAAVGGVGLESRHAIYGPTVFADDTPAELLAAPRLLRASQARRVVSAQPDCTMQEICDLLRAMASKQGIRTQDGKRMPEAPE